MVFLTIVLVSIDDAGFLMFSVSDAELDESTAFLCRLWWLMLGGLIHRLFKIYSSLSLLSCSLFLCLGFTEDTASISWLLSLDLFELATWFVKDGIFPFSGLTIIIINRN